MPTATVNIDELSSSVSDVTRDELERDAGIALQNAQLILATMRGIDRANEPTRYSRFARAVCAQLDHAFEALLELED